MPHKRGNGFDNERVAHLLRFWSRFGSSFEVRGKIRVIHRNAKAIWNVVISLTAVHNERPFADSQDERPWRLSLMGSGSSCRISRCFRPRECEISSYRHGCDPPKHLKVSWQLQPRLLPTSAPRLNTLRKHAFIPSDQEIATWNSSSTSRLRLCDADVEVVSWHLSVVHQS